MIAAAVAVVVVGLGFVVGDDDSVGDLNADGGDVVGGELQNVLEAFRKHTTKETILKFFKN